jgi:hypothetical protein
MYETTSAVRWLQALAVVHACVGLGVVPLLARQVLRSELVVLLVLHGVLAVLVAGALLVHYRFALQIAMGFSLAVTLVGLGAVIALPVPSGMMRSTFLLVRWMALLLLLPSLGSVLVCLLVSTLRQAIFHPL